MNTAAENAFAILPARRGAAAIETDVAPAEVARWVAAGTIVIVRHAFEPAAARELRDTLAAWRPPPDAPTHIGSPVSFRIRREDPPGPQARFAFENSLFAVENPDDKIGRAVRAPFERLAAYWRALTGLSHGFVPGPDGLAVRPWAMHFPRGGGHLDWHTHRLEPQRIGLVLGLSEPGVDHASGETQFETPHGIVGTGGRHGLGDLCLFRNDLRHRVTAVDPQSPRRWDGSGRWTLIIPLQADLPPGSP